MPPVTPPTGPVALEPLRAPCRAPSPMPWACAERPPDEGIIVEGFRLLPQLVKAAAPTFKPWCTAHPSARLPACCVWNPRLFVEHRWEDHRSRSRLKQSPWAGSAAPCAADPLPLPRINFRSTQRHDCLVRARRRGSAYWSGITCRRAHEGDWPAAQRGRSGTLMSSWTLDESMRSLKDRRLVSVTALPSRCFAPRREERSTLNGVGI